MGLLTAGTIVYILFFLKKQSKGIAQVLNMPEFKGKAMELRLLGGLASLKVTDGQGSVHSLENGGRPGSRYLESPGASRVRELSELARLLENDLITREEYQQAKDRMFGGGHDS